VRQAGPNKVGSVPATDEEVDPRLKNFEPRIVELIISEVISCLLTKYYDCIAHIYCALFSWNIFEIGKKLEVRVKCQEIYKKWNYVYQVK